MIDPHRDWTWEPQGGRVLLRPRGDLDAGHIVYRERVRPMARVGAVTAAEIERLRATVVSIAPPTAFVTDEGEHAGLQLADVTVEDAPRLLVQGVVYGDDFYAHLAGVCRDDRARARFTDATRAFAQGDRHMLGVRRRRFLYTPPPGWHGTTRQSPMHAYFYAPGSPVDGSELVVNPAVPSGDADDALLPAWIEAQAARMGGAAQRSRLREVARGSLRGDWWELRGRGKVIDAVALLDDRYFYSLVLTSPPAPLARNRALLTALIATIEPVPGRRASVEVQHVVNLAAHWA